MGDAAVRRLALAVALAAGSTEAVAQAAQPAPHLGRRSAITANPVAAVIGFLTGDIETSTSPSVTVGAGWSVTAMDDFDKYRAFDAKVRYWPGGRALEGFAVTGSVGIASAEGSEYDGTTVRVKRVSRPTFGSEVSYGWLIGPMRRFVVVLGVGAKRYTGSNNNNSSLDSSVLPTARGNIGFRF